MQKDETNNDRPSPQPSPAEGRGSIEDYDKLPAVVETVTHRKTADEFAFTIVTPRKYEELAKNFMRRLSSIGVFCFIPCVNIDQVEGLLKENHSGISASIGTPAQEIVEGRYVDVATMAELLGMTERNVQLQAEKGLLVRGVRGQYDTLASCGTLWQALKESEASTGDTLRNERVLITRAKREAAQLDNFERAKKLGNCEECIKVRITKNAEIKQRILSFEKVLPQKTGGRAAEEQVPIIRNEIRKLLIDLAATERPVGDDSRSGQDIPSAAGLHGEPVGRRKTKTKRKD